MIMQRPRYVRVNTLLLSVEDAISELQNEGWQLLSRSATYSSYLLSLSRLSEPYFIQDLHIPEVLVFPPSTSFHEHPGYLKGMLILQDKASCLPVHLLNPVSGSVVLDMCAAPGMKATYLAAKLQNNGKVYAVEIDTKRFDTLCSLIEKTQSSCVEPINQDTLTLDPKQYSQVEYILVDPSCSGSGIVDRPKQSDTDGKPEPERLQNLQSFQVYLLRYALLNFPNAKRIIYSTCSLHPEENEQVIDEVLTDIRQAYRLVPARELLGDTWINFSSEEYNCTDKCLYSKPDVDFCNGFFVAVFERDFAVALPMCKRKGGNVNSIDANVGANVDTPAPADDETVSRKRKKRGKRKKREASVTDEQVKNQQGDAEFKPEVENEEQVKKRKKEVDTCLSSDNNREEISNEKQLERRKEKKKKKKRL
ncbi:hypothetical protein DMN91_003091 [Ooceraea biroi]|uniref:SAM-dependent MTase RsmB/NOP-type domain-containing protein n=1 Tax=Ooceraea biroi TaxID=2015173 RepID=A0A3L8DYH1_OOCBI|nr:hypothetical protein DMN91_003091 [Ooceraea biroi]